MSLYQLSDCCEFIRDGTHNTPPSMKIGVPVLSATHVKDGYLSYRTDRYASENELLLFRKRLHPKPGDVLITIVGTIGRTAIITEDRPLIFQRSVCVLRPKKGITDSAYLKYALEAEGVKKQLEREIHQVAQAGVYLEAINNITIPLPPLPEQQRIAAILQKADRVRRLRRYARSLSEGYLQSVFLEMYGDPATNPKGWDRFTLEELGTNFFYGTSEKCHDQPAGLPVLRIPNILDEQIDLTNLKYAKLPDKEVEKLRLHIGDLIFVRTNGNPDYVGRCSVFDIPGNYLFASYLICGRLDSKKLMPEFVASFLRSSFGRRAMSPYIRTTAGQSNIGIEGLGQVPLIVPPMDFQKKFIDNVSSYRNVNRRQIESSRQAEHLFQSLLVRAFSGNL